MSRNESEDEKQLAKRSDSDGEGSGVNEASPVLKDGAKRERKKVERLTAKELAPPPEKKNEVKSNGNGTLLGDMPRVEFFMKKRKADDLKIIHRILFNRPGTATTIRKNIRIFNGFSFTSGSDEFDRKKININKLTTSQLKNILEMFDLERSGTKETLVDRLLTWLLKPVASARKVPQTKKRKGSGETKKSSTKSANKSTKAAKRSAEEDDDQNESEDDEDSEEDEEEEQEEEKEEEPVPKKKKVATPVKKKTPVKQKPKVKSKPVKSKESDSEKESEPADSSSDDDEDSKPLAVVKETAPSNEKLKQDVEQMLKNANLEEVTMKTIVKQVYEKYPNFNLTDRKDFIKKTVKEVLN